MCLQNTVTSCLSSAVTCLHTADPSPGDPASLYQCPQPEDRKRSKSHGLVGGIAALLAEPKGRELRLVTAFIVLLKPARKGLEVTSPLIDNHSHQSQNVSSDTPVGCWGCFMDSCSFASHLITCIHWTLTRETVSFTIFFLFLFSFHIIHPNHSLPSPQIHPFASLQKRTSLSGYQPNMA